MKTVGWSLGMLVTASAVSLGGCTGTSRVDPLVTQRDSSGVRLVEVSGELGSLDWTFDRRMEIGGREEGPESFYRVSPALVDVGVDGKIHVLDPIHHRIVSFSSTGAYLGSVGREGDGPTEFKQPFAFALSAEGDFVVADRARSGLIRLSSRGTELPSIQVDAPIFGASGAAVAGTTPVFTMFQWTGPSGGVESLLWGSSPRELARVELLGPSGSGFTSCPGAFVGLSLLDRGLLWSTSRTGVVVSPSLEYEILVFDRGELRTLIRRDVDRQPATPRAVAENLGETFEARTGRGTCAVPVDEAIRTKGYLPEVPAVTALALSPAGRIWVRRGTLPDTLSLVDVYEADGTPLGALPPGTPFPIAFTDGGIATAEEGDFGVQRLVVYDIREGPASRPDHR